MSLLYLYAILGAPPEGPLPHGVAGELIRLVDCGEVLAAAGEVPAAPAVEAAALRRHDDAVRRLAAATPAVLPARFGSVVADEPALVERLAPAAAALREALAVVAGREQMTLRIFSPAADRGRAAGEAETEDHLGPGTAYLRSRLREWMGEQRVAELEPLRPVLERFVLAERVERHQTPPLVASIYHLVTRGEAARYTTTVEAAATAAGIRLAVSGPWPPYAFAPAAV